MLFFAATNGILLGDSGFATARRFRVGGFLIFAQVCGESQGRLEEHRYCRNRGAHAGEIKSKNDEFSFQTEDFWLVYASPRGT